MELPSASMSLQMTGTRFSIACALSPPDLALSRRRSAA